MPQKGLPVKGAGLNLKIPIPSFFLPVFAFFLWNIIFLSYLPVLETDFDFSRQIVLANLYLSNIILILTWFLCGKLMFILFSIVFLLEVTYLMLSIGDWGLSLHQLTVVFLYFWLRHITGKIEYEKMQKMMERDKIQEKLNLSAKSLEEREHLLQALHRKMDRLQYMRQFSDNLKETMSLEAAAEIITREVMGLIPEAEHVLLYVCDDNTRELGLAAQSYTDESHRSKAKKGNEYDEWVVKRLQPLLIEDTRTDFRFMTDASKQSHYRSVCLVPLLSKSSVCGVLHLSSTQPNMFNTDDLRLLDIVSDLSAVVIRNIILYEKTKELSIVDSLTDCYLLRYVQERLSEEIFRSMRNKTQFALIMADIDFFKTYNDQYGHTAGDVVLKTIATIIKSNVGSSDIVGRYGGEEFIIIVPQKSITEGVELAERLRCKVEECEFDLRREKKKITVSFGVAQFPRDGSTREEMISKADENLYEAKRQGRNRVVS